MSVDALELALALHQAPIQRFTLRDRPLPENIGDALQLASAMQPQLEKAAVRFSEYEDTIVEAVRFYLHQVLFEPGTDAYRVLGLKSDADSSLIRQHHIWLQRWLHPDRRGEDWEAVLATKVNWAWQQLRNEASRAKYDQTRLSADPSADNSDAKAVLIQTPAWSAAPIDQTRPHWLRRAAIGSLLLVFVGLFYLAATRQDRVDPDALASQTVNSRSSIRPRVPFEADRSPGKSQISVPIAEQNPAAEVATSSGLIETHRLKPIVPSAQRTMDAERRDAPHRAGNRAVDVVENVAASTVSSVASPSNIDSPTDEPIKSVSRKRPIGNAASDVAEIIEPAIRLASAARANANATSASPSVTHSADTVASPSTITSNKPQNATQSTARKHSPAPAISPMLGPSKVAIARASPEQPTAAIVKPSQLTPKLVPPADSIAVLKPTDSPRDQHENVADSSAARADKPEVTNPPEQIAQPTPEELSRETLARFELARERVRTMVDYFRDQQARAPAWDDAQGLQTVARERSALWARNGQAEIDSFALDPPTWRVTHSEVDLQAVYHVDATRNTAETGRFKLNMAWQDGRWKITRIEVSPSQ